MDTQEFQIRAKKISELDNFDREIDDHTYLIIGYNNGTVKQNYKLTLSNLISLIKSDTFIDDDALLQKLNMFIYNDQIHIPTGSQGAQGPQGPQGEKGSGYDGDIDFSEIQNQINELSQLVNRYHSSYAITYNLSNISPKNTNPNIIKYGDVIELYFNPNAGYKMPNSISWSGCDCDYNKTNKSVTISNPTDNVVINITADIQTYTISYNFEHINYVIESNEKQQYNINESIRLTLTPEENYVLPNSITANNCSTDYRINETSTGSLIVTCSGTGDMSISCTGISNINYYFGLISINDSTYDKIEVNFTTRPNDESEITGISLVNIKSLSWLQSSKKCPFNINSPFELQNEVNLGDETVMIIPKKYFDPTTSIFTDGLNTGKFHSTSSSFTFNFNIYKLITIEDVEYYCVDMQDGLSGNDGSTYIIN